MRKLFTLFLCMLLLFSLPVSARGFAAGQPFHAQLEGLIRNESRREYVQMMLDHYIRTDLTVQKALKRNGSAIFLFDGCSDNMDDPELGDISYYRVSAVCIAIRLDEQGMPYIAYFNGECSTLPDRPLDYGAWRFEEVGEVGPATVCDGSYELYSVLHAGSYEALHVRTDVTDKTVSAVYMTPEGYYKTRATEINVHTRTGNHILEKQMWSAGCILVGGGEWSHFTELMESTYYARFARFEVGRYVGSLTIDRQLLQEPMYRLYENRDAVDMLLAHSRSLLPETYLRRCQPAETYDEPVTLCVRGTFPLMSLPCSNPTDARSLQLGEVTRGQELQATGILQNSEGKQWYQIDCKGQTCYLYTGYAEESGWRNWITRFWWDITKE